MHLRTPRGRQGDAAQQRAGAPVEHQQLGIRDAQHPIASRIGQQRGDRRGGGDGGEPGTGRAGEGDDRGVSRREDQVRPAVDGDGAGGCAIERGGAQAGAAGGVERQQGGGGVDVDPPRRLVQRHRGGVLPRRAGGHQPRPFRRDQRVGQRGAGGEGLRPLCPDPWRGDQRDDQRQRGYYPNGPRSSRHTPPFSAAVPQTTPIPGTAAWLRCVSSGDYRSASHGTTPAIATMVSLASMSPPAHGRHVAPASVVRNTWSRGKKLVACWSSPTR